MSYLSCYSRYSRVHSRRSKIPLRTATLVGIYQFQRGDTIMFCKRQSTANYHLVRSDGQISYPHAGSQVSTFLLLQKYFDDLS